MVRQNALFQTKRDNQDNQDKRDNQDSTPLTAPRFSDQASGNKGAKT